MYRRKTNHRTDLVRWEFEKGEAILSEGWGGRRGESGSDSLPSNEYTECFTFLCIGATIISEYTKLSSHHLI